MNVQIPDGRVIAFPDSMSEADVRAALLKISAPAPKLQATPSTFQRGLNTVSALAPAGGGLVGGLMGAEAGPVGSIAGAALGGAAGRSLQGMMSGRLASAPELGASAASQAALEATGIGAGAAARGIGGRFMRPPPVTFQGKAALSPIFDQFGRQFETPGRTVQFQRAIPPAAKKTAQAVAEMATHFLPGGPFARLAARPVMKGLASGMTRMAPSVGRWVATPGAQMLARQSPRAFIAAVQALQAAAEPDATSQ